MQVEKLNTCRWWLERGFYILPCQRNTKFLVKGFGEYQKRCRNIGQVRWMFEQYYDCNIAVIGGDQTIILDFDDQELYKAWAEKVGPDIAGTYTEQTPRGGYHVFMFGDRPHGIKLKQGVELKRVCIVSPSKIERGSYIAGSGEPRRVAAEYAFSSLSIPGTPTARILLNGHRRAYKPQIGGNSMVETIKRENDILHVFSVYRPDQDVDTSKRYSMVLCPFHEDHKPSMFLDRDLQIYKCFTCGEHGDVINLYAKFQGVTVQEAIARLSRKGVRS